MFLNFFIRAVFIQTKLYFIPSCFQLSSKLLVVAMNSTNLCMLCMSAIMLRIDGDSVACATGHSELKDLHQHFTHQVQARVMQNYNSTTQQFKVLLKKFCIELRILLFCEFISISKKIIVMIDW